jgi:hypothetical protein
MTSPVASQQPPQGAVLTQFRASGATASQLAETITGSLELTLRLAGVPQVRRADYLWPEALPEETVRHYRRLGAATAVYGLVTPRNGGGFVIEATVWSAETSARARVRNEIDSVFGVFDLADQLALDIAAEVVGRDLSFAEVRLGLPEALDDFAVYADGQLLGRNQSRFRVLAGERLITVAVPGPLGDQPIQEFEVELRPNAVESLSVNPAPEPANGEPGLGREPSPTASGRSGNLVIASSPSGVPVFLDGRSIGSTPLEVLSVGEGTYELTLEEELFRPLTLAAVVRAGESVTVNENLEVDTSHPRVSSRLRRPGLVSAAALSGGLLKGGLLAWGGTGSRVWTYDATEPGRGDRSILPAVDWVMLSALQPGMWLASDGGGAWLSSAFTAGLTGAGLGLFHLGRSIERETGSPRWLSTIGVVTVVAAQPGGLLFELLAAPAVSRASDRRLLERIASTGAVPEQPSAHRPRFVLETGAGGLARALFVPSLGIPWLRSEFGGGVSLSVSSPAGIGTLVSVRAAVRPFIPTAIGIKPEISVFAQGETDFRRVGGQVGAGLGTIFALAPFELFWRVNYMYGLSTRAQSFRSSVGIGL